MCDRCFNCFYIMPCVSGDKRELEYTRKLDLHKRHHVPNTYY